MSCVKTWSFWPNESNTPYLKQGLATKPTFPPCLVPLVFILHYNRSCGISQMTLSVCQGCSLEHHTKLCLFHRISGITTDLWRITLPLNSLSDSLSSPCAPFLLSSDSEKEQQPSQLCSLRSRVTQSGPYRSWGLWRNKVGPPVCCRRV